MSVVTGGHVEDHPPHRIPCKGHNKNLMEGRLGLALQCIQTSLSIKKTLSSNPSTIQHQHLPSGSRGLHSDFQASPSYKRPCFKNKTKNKAPGVGTYR